MYYNNEQSRNNWGQQRTNNSGQRTNNSGQRNNNVVNSTGQIKPKVADEEFFNKITKDYAGTAENVIVQIKNSGNNLPTVSAIRNILELINIVREKMVFSSEELSKELQNEIQYIRVKVAYIYGKDKAIKPFIDASKIIELVMCIGASKSKFEIFAQYVEALVAFHKFYGGD